MYYLEPDVAALLSLTFNIVNWPKKRFPQRAPLKTNFICRTVDTSKLQTGSVTTLFSVVI